LRLPLYPCRVGRDRSASQDQVDPHPEVPVKHSGA